MEWRRINLFCYEGWNGNKINLVKALMANCHLSLKMAIEVANFLDIYIGRSEPAPEDDTNGYFDGEL